MIGQRKIVITGATGFIGANLARYLSGKGFQVIAFSRNLQKSRSILPDIDEHVLFNADSSTVEQTAEQLDALENAVALINLAGAPIGAKRWTDDYKNILLSSRINTTNSLVELIKQLDEPPLLLNASATGFYGERGTELLNEDSSSGKDFLASVTIEWEKAASKASDYTRVVPARIGLVLGQGGALGKLIPPFKFFAGGPLGNGRQYWSWVHIEDLLCSFEFIINNEISGPVNIVSPSSIQMKKFAQTLGKVMKRPAVFPAPSFILKIILGEASEMVLCSQRVVPKKLLDNGFNFKFSDLSTAFKNIIE